MWRILLSGWNAPDRNLPTLNLVYSFYWLAPCFFVLFSAVFFLCTDIQSQHWLWWAKMELKKTWGFSLDTSCLSRRKRKHHVSDWSLSLTLPIFLWGQCLLFSPLAYGPIIVQLLHVRLVSHLQLSPHPVSQSVFPWGHKPNLTTGTFVLWVPVSVRCNSLKMSLITTGRGTHMKGGATRLELVLQAQNTELKYSWSHVSLLILTPHGVWHTAIWNILVTLLV